MVFIIHANFCFFVTFPCEIDYCEYYPWNIHKFCDNRISPKPERERNNSHEDMLFLMPTNFCFDSFVTFLWEIYYWECYPWNPHKLWDNRVSPKRERDKNNSHEDMVFIIHANFCFHFVCYISMWNLLLWMLSLKSSSILGQQSIPKTTEREREKKLTWGYGFPEYRSRWLGGECERWCMWSMSDRGLASTVNLGWPCGGPWPLAKAKPFMPLSG